MSEAPWLALVVEHYRRPRNHRSLAGATHVHEGTNPLCGDRLRMQLEVRDGRVADAGFQASACAIATASASLLTERVRGVSVRDAEAIDEDSVIGALGAGVPAARLRCATLALHVMRRALAGAGA